MLALSVSLLLIGPCAAEAVPGPRLAKGDELHYVGEVVESSETVDNPFRKTHALEVRLFILENDDASATGAVLTTLTRDADPALAGANIGRKGAVKQAVATSSKLEFVRIDRRGRVEVLQVPGGPVLRFEKAQRLAPAPLPVDAPPLSEFGFLIPTPNEGATLGTPWNLDGSRWMALPQGTWNGRRCWEVTGHRATEHYDRPEVAPKGWQSATVMLVAPGDGFASQVERTTTRRFGNEPIGKVTVKYELRPTNRYVGTRYLEARQEVETAWAMTSDFEAGLATAKPSDLVARAVKIQRYLDDHPGTEGFGAAIHALKRRAEALASGGVPYVAPSGPSRKIAAAESLREGEIAPDFIATDVDLPGNRFRLQAAKGKPVVLIFFKPRSATSQDALTIAEALSKRYGERATVVPLAIGSKPEAASEQRAELKFRVPVFDGTETRTAYRVETFPQFLIVDGQGKLNWKFDSGVGPEVGYLVKEALEKILPKTEAK